MIGVITLNLPKRYSDFLNEITSDEIYKGLLAYGMFTEKIPPIFSAESFFDYCASSSVSFPKAPTEYIFYENMRNINTPRPLAIPNPATYAQLCKYISKIWSKLQQYFEEETQGQNYSISRIHLRKKKSSGTLFSMNYKDWKADGTPEPDLLLGAKYLVHADISNCFPSMYTHALSWALVGKDVAKQNQSNHDEWYNQLDYFTRNIKHGETHGLLIGPHVSNLLSEIILVKVDKVLYDAGFRYTRNIDDYSCYVSSYEEGQRFLTKLTEQLRAYDLTLNHKKTSIEELPKASIEQWVRKINAFTAFDTKEEMNFKEVRAYLDMAIDLMQDNNDNAAILNYAMKVLAKKKLTENAQTYYVKTMGHLVIIYPYLITLLEEFVYEPFSVSQETIAKISNLIYDEGARLNNYEAVCFSLYFAIKYGFEIESVNVDSAKGSNHCLFLLFAYLYFQKQKDRASIRVLKDHAKVLQKTEMEPYWLFVYEVLPQSELRDYWKPMKRKGVSFLVAN